MNLPRRICTYFFLRVAVPGICLLSGFPSVGMAAERQPDIVFVLLDDLRWDGLSLMGHPYVQTPNIDRLRSQGALMQNAFVSTSICCPSRATFLTGTYASRHGVIDNETSEYDPDVTPPLTKYLQEAGYSTAMIGKWHMGNTAAPRPYFDHWVSFKGQGTYNDVEMNVNGKKVQWEGYTTDLLTDEAIRFIQNQPKGKPYFCMLSHKAVHEPFHPAPRHADAFGAETTDIEPPSWSDDFAGKPAWLRRNQDKDVRWNWRSRDIERNPVPDAVEVTPWPTQKKYIEQFRCLSAVDEGVGRILEVLEARGTLENTLIVFTSDNGYFHGEHRRWDKRLAYEESMRIPMIVVYPKQIQAGMTVEEMVSNIDFAPTMLSFAGLPMPAQMQGNSMQPLLLGTETKWQNLAYYEYWVDLVHAIPTMVGLRDTRYKLIRYPDIQDLDELYDLEEDPYELHNLVTDDTYREIHQRLSGLLGDKAGQAGWHPHVFPKNLERFRGKEGLLFDLAIQQGRPVDQGPAETEIQTKDVVVSNQAFHFDGKTSRMEVPFDADMDPSGWPYVLKVSFKTESDGVIAVQGKGNYGFKLFVQDGRPGVSTLCKTWVPSQTTLDAADSVYGEWTEVEVHIDYNRLMFFVNGELAGSASLPQPFKGKTNSSLIIGAPGPQVIVEGTANTPFKGAIRRFQLERSVLEQPFDIGEVLAVRPHHMEWASLQGAPEEGAATGKRIQFGWKAEDIQVPAYRAAVGADEIIQWNGVNSWGEGSFAANGSLVNQEAGASVFSKDKAVMLSTTDIGSEEADATVTSSAGFALGISPKGKWGNFEEATSDRLTFSFNQDVKLAGFLFVGVKAKDQDRVNLKIGELPTRTFTVEDMADTHAWSKMWDLKKLSFDEAVVIPAGTAIRIEVAESDNPDGNVFGLGAVIIDLP